MNNRVLKERSEENISKILKRFPSVFGLTHSDIKQITIDRATEIVYGNYKKAFDRLNESHMEVQELKNQIENLHLNEKRLEAAIRIDPLTGLRNRRAFDEICQDLAERNNDAVFIFIDLKAFKTINDTLGHDEGDKTLVAVAEVFKEINASIKGKGQICRTGGDEFIGVFYDMPLQEGEEMARLIREKLRDKFSDGSTDAHPVEATMGVSSLDEAGKYNFEVEQKIKNKHQTEREKLISRTMKMGDSLLHPAKDHPDGILSEFDEEYLSNNDTELSEKNKELKVQLDYILRHWINDEKVSQYIREIRKLTLPMLSYHESISDIDDLIVHMTHDGLEETWGVTREIIAILRQQLIKFRDFFNLNQSETPDENM